VRPETRTTCSECGAETTVPFKPTQGRPVLCRSCFQKIQGTPSPAPEAANAHSVAPESKAIAETEAIPEPN
jgi:CxxC-x17-CxxC domain-containing protein